jgi:hypothetical protein
MNEATKVLRNIKNMVEGIYLNSDAVYVNEKIDGKWQSIPLDDLPAKMVLKHVINFMRRMPCVKDTNQSN